MEEFRMSDLRELGDISLPFALDKKKNYIYIKDADRGTNYYCPCCNKEVNTIAIDEGVDYKMPPHYRHHPNQSCTGESLAHWVYKIWLFDKDSQFNVYNGTDKINYTVETIDIEKTYPTDYGDYRPDISIVTTCGKIFFFELNFSNPKRGDDYFCKWSQLNNDVIEVDVKKLLKESFNNKVPTFRLIYADGLCFDDKYNRRDAFANASNILSTRKFEIKRQDMLNYKTVWEKLDWFFNSIKLYKAMKSTIDDVLESFSNIPFEEMELCFNIVKNISCIDNNDDFRNIINDEFHHNINQYIEDVKSNNKHISTFQCKIEIRKGCDIKIIGVQKKCEFIDFLKPMYMEFYKNKKWYMGYDYYLLLTKDINQVLTNINNHHFTINAINDYFTWNKYPLFFDNLDFKKIELRNNFIPSIIEKTSDYNIEKIIYTIDKKYKQILLDSYREILNDIELNKINSIYKQIA